MNLATGGDGYLDCKEARKIGRDSMLLRSVGLSSGGKFSTVADVAATVAVVSSSNCSKLLWLLCFCSGCCFVLLVAFSTLGCG